MNLEDNAEALAQTLRTAVQKCHTENTKETFYWSTRDNMNKPQIVSEKGGCGRECPEGNEVGRGPSGKRWPWSCDLRDEKGQPDRLEVQGVAGGMQFQKRPLLGLPGPCEGLI